MRVWIGLGVLQLQLVAQLVVRPYRTAAQNRLDTLSLTAQFVSLFVGQAIGLGIVAPSDEGRVDTNSTDEEGARANATVEGGARTIVLEVGTTDHTRWQLAKVALGSMISYVLRTWNVGRERRRRSRSCRSCSRSTPRSTCSPTRWRRCARGGPRSIWAISGSRGWARSSSAI